MFDKVTTLTISYLEFFEIFAQTKRILVEKHYHLISIYLKSNCWLYKDIVAQI